MNNDIAVARLDELAEGQLKEIQVNDTKLLLARVGDTVYAVGAACPHYQAPLAKGLLCGHRLYCPWHHSSFDITSGHLLDPPSLDGLPTYPVRLDDGQIFVTLPDTKTDPSNVPDVSLTTGDDRTIVIIGGGAAGYFAAQTLRQQQFGGRILLVTRDSELPYDRAKLSKNFLDGRATAEKVPLRAESFYEELRVEVQVGREVTAVDADAHKITFADGDSLHYSALLVASGSEPNRLNVPGADLPGLFTLRFLDDAQRIVDQLVDGKKVVIIGGSFIGLEVAASLRKRGLDVTVVAQEDVLYEKVLGAEIGAMFQRLHEENGVTFRLGVNVASLEGNDKVEAVILGNGDRLAADLVVAGIGVTPNTAFLRGLSLHEKDQSVPVDTYLQAAPDLFAAGDIARFPDARNNNVPTRIEHWRTAQQHGITAAMNLLGGKKTVAELVPFFWTNQYEKRLSYVGHADGWNEIIVQGNVPDQNFIAFYVKDDRVVAVASMNHDKESMAAEELMRLGTFPAVSAIKNGLADLVKLATN